VCESMSPRSVGESAVLRGAPSRSPRRGRLPPSLRLRACDTGAPMRTTAAGLKTGGPAALRGPLATLLRCLQCAGSVRPEGGNAAALSCQSCGAPYVVARGTVRMVVGAAADEDDVKAKTARSFSYEWSHYGAMRPEWKGNFSGYVRPLTPDWFEGKRVLDVGTGSGRHSYHAARLGAHVVACDLGDSIDVARRNLPDQVLTVQADAEALPFASGCFDLVMSIGVLHHLPDQQTALQEIVRCTKPGGRVQLYVYWQPPVQWHRPVLRLVGLARRITVRMPHPLLRALCYPLAAGLFLAFVAPYRALRRSGRFHSAAQGLPLKAYMNYPFGVLVNDQFDRFSAPLECRFTAAEVDDLLANAGLEERQVIAHHGWVASGRRPMAP
jgi:ubiquinone/menaquinone biosynthesis C-methylase UbiE